MKHIAAIVVGLVVLALATGCQTSSSRARPATWRDVDVRINCQDRATAWLRAAYRQGITNGLGRCFYFPRGEIKRGNAHVIPYYTARSGKRIYIEPYFNRPITLTPQELAASYHRPGFSLVEVHIVANGSVYPIMYGY